MNYLLKGYPVPMLAAVTLRKMRRSVKVAQTAWNASFAFLFVAACSGSIMMILGALLLLMGASAHRTKVEKRVK